MIQEAPDFFLAFIVAIWGTGQCPPAVSTHVAVPADITCTLHPTKHGRSIHRLHGLTVSSSNLLYSFLVRTGSFF